MQNTPLVSIISINYNELEVTCELLDSIRDKNTYSNIEIIIVDNASKVDPKSYISCNYPNVNVINSDENLGFSGGNNIGIRASQGEYLFFINNDAVIQENTISELLKTFETQDNVGIVSPMIYYFPENPNDKLRIQFAGTTFVNGITGRNKTIGLGTFNPDLYAEIRTTAYIHGAAMMASRKAVEKSGLMPEIFFLYYEELDWSEMFRRAGFGVYINPKANILHKESYSIGTNSTLKTHYITRNRMLFMKRNRTALQNFLFKTFFLLVSVPKTVLKHAIKGEWKHIKSIREAISWNFKHKNLDKTEYLTPALHKNTK